MGARAPAETEVIEVASIVNRRGSYYVVYMYSAPDGKRKQKWETYKTPEEAERRLAEVEYQLERDGFAVPPCATLDDLLREYVSLYGKTEWSASMYASSTGMIKNYISPMIGSMKLSEITPRALERFYKKLLGTKAARRATDGKYERIERNVSASTVRKIHNLLRSCFKQAVKWDLMRKNPAESATVPKAEAKKREIWDIETLSRAMDACRDERLKMAMNLSFACTLRAGEVLGLTWDCVDIDSGHIESGTASVYVCKELQRISREAAEELDGRDIIYRFPGQNPENKTELVLKKPKTESSVRRVFLPRTVAEMLVSWRRKQEGLKEALGDEYTDFNLVMAGPAGSPTDISYIQKSFRRLIRENDLPEVVFHSIRHASITYKLKLSGGDIKAVQGDSGHAEAKMVTDQYSHILDEGRKENARLIEDSFYSKAGGVANAEGAEGRRKLDADALERLLSDPEISSLLETLAEKVAEEKR